MYADPRDPRLQPRAYIHNGTDDHKGRLAAVLAYVPCKVTIEYCDSLEVVALAPSQITGDWTLVRAAPRGDVPIPTARAVPTP